jgi:hypothetical protein
VIELAFKTLQLRGWCEDPDRKFTSAKPEVIEQLKGRLADLRAANSPLDLLAGSPKLISDKPPRVILQLAQGYELICTVNQEKPRVDNSGKIIWEYVRRLQVASIKEARS